jgi:hypothetical protein
MNREERHSSAGDRRDRQGYSVRFLARENYRCRNLRALTGARWTAGGAIVRETNRKSSRYRLILTKPDDRQRGCLPLDRRSQAAINRFLKETNDDPKSFVWTSDSR